jgi:hypothetical protein
MSPNQGIFSFYQQFFKNEKNPAEPVHTGEQVHTGGKKKSKNSKKNSKKRCGTRKIKPKFKWF